MQQYISKGLQGFLLSCSPYFEEGGISTDFLVSAKKSDNFSTVKGKITKVINSLIADCKGFKIGKSGSPKSRFSNYIGYNRMFLLCQSRCASVIEYLEAYYTTKYLDCAKCDNINGGSASDMTVSGLYFLYVVLR
jgi:hypothetical protein